MGEDELTKNLCEFEGRSPTGQRGRLMRIPRGGLLAHFEETGNRSKFDEACLIPDVCGNPSGIWRNLKRAGQEEAFCYAGTPSGEFAKKFGKDIRIPPGFVFLVFLTKDLEVTKWRYAKEDPDSPGFPTENADRFGERLWPPD